MNEESDGADKSRTLNIESPAACTEPKDNGRIALIVVLILLVVLGGLGWVAYQAFTSVAQMDQATSFEPPTDTDPAVEQVTRGAALALTNYQATNGSLPHTATEVGRVLKRVVTSEVSGFEFFRNGSNEFCLVAWGSGFEGWTYEHPLVFDSKTDRRALATDRSSICTLKGVTTGYYIGDFTGWHSELVEAKYIGTAGA